MKTNSINQNRVFELRPYRKTELALMYFPESTKETAVRLLTRWMKEDPGIMSELQTIGYNKRRQYLLKREVEVIVKYIGEPF